MLICLHVGAHKTASTYMQSRLYQDRNALLRRGVDQIPHAQARKQIAERLDTATRFGAVGYGVARRVIAKALTEALGAQEGRERLIISDENIAGGMTSAVDARGLYPDIGPRLGAAIGAMPKTCELEVFFCVRDYAGFFSSIFAYRAGQRIGQDEKAFRARALGLKRGWREVVADISAAAGPERTTVWTYEAFSQDPERIGHALTGDWKPRVFVKGDKARLPSLSRKGLAVLERASDILTQVEYAGLARVIAQIEFDPPDEKFSLFDAAETAKLSARYRADLEAIAGLGCKLLVPGEAEAQASPA